MRRVPGYGLLACPAAEQTAAEQTTVVDEEERTASEILQTGTPAEVAIALSQRGLLTTPPSQDLGRLSSGVKVTHS